MYASATQGGHNKSRRRLNVNVTACFFHVESHSHKSYSHIRKCECSTASGRWRYVARHSAVIWTRFVSLTDAWLYHMRRRLGLITTRCLCYRQPHTTGDQLYSDLLIPRYSLSIIAVIYRQRNAPTVSPTYNLFSRDSQDSYNCRIK